MQAPMDECKLRLQLLLDAMVKKILENRASLTKKVVKGKGTITHLTISKKKCSSLYGRVFCCNIIKAISKAVSRFRSGTET